ncbi:unnamed protein product [Ilex paraguariensis]|uniref:Uncharacterized protein n=1 Tax=Ilex paraguariensis TaxID=185542 RepID=A0ABC8U0N6_9AQUA
MEYSLLLCTGRWSKIASKLPGRTDNEIKNFWNTHLRKKLLHDGIDPRTHRPVYDLNLLLNLSQLLSTPNFSNLMNPWGNALKLQTDATHLSQIELLKSILQFINTSPLPNIDQTSFLGLQNYAQIDGFLHGTNTLHTVDQPQEPFHGYSTAITSYSQALFERVSSQEVLNANGNSLISTGDYQTECPLPALVLDTPESTIVNQMENTEPAYISAHSPTSNFFEDWEKLLDGEASSSFWKDIID